MDSVFPSLSQNCDLLNAEPKEPAPLQFVFQAPLRMSMDLLEEGHRLNRSDFAEYLAWAQTHQIEENTMANKLKALAAQRQSYRKVQMTKERVEVPLKTQPNSGSIEEKDLTQMSYNGPPESQILQRKDTKVPKLASGVENRSTNMAHEQQKQQDDAVMDNGEPAVRLPDLAKTETLISDAPQ